jgi:hypothetical protein
VKRLESVARQVWQEFSPREDEALAFEDFRDGLGLITVTIGESGGEAFDADPDEPLGTLAAYLADRMQTVIMEERQQMVPECPLHPTAHPLDSTVVDGSAAWTCPSTRRPVRYMRVSAEGA